MPLQEWSESESGIQLTEPRDKLRVCTKKTESASKIIALHDCDNNHDCNNFYILFLISSPLQDQLSVWPVVVHL